MNLPLKEIKDPLNRKCFELVQDSVNNPLMGGEWKFFEITVDTASTNYKYKHNLKFVPKDVIQLSVTGAGSLTWNYASFDTDNLDLTTTGPCTVRAFIGRCNG